jgi:hypothetical protein
MPYEPIAEQTALFSDIGKLSAPRKTIARLADCDETMLARAAAGTRNLSYIEFRPIRGVVDELLVLKDRSNGLPINWGDVRRLRELLADLRSESAPEPLTDQEANLLREFSTTDDVHRLAIDLGISRGDLLLRVENLLNRSKKLAEAAKIEA